MNWRLKAALFRWGARTPGAMALNRRLKARAAQRIDVSLHLTPALKMLRRLREQRGFTPAGKAVLEIGVGWNPVYGVLFSLLGAGRVVLLDVERFLTVAGVQRVLAQLTNRLPEIAAATGAEEGALRARRDELAAAPSWPEVARLARFEYLAPADAASVPLPDGAIDLYCSTCVLEHVPEGDLPALHRETVRLLASRGLAYHIIDLSDHYAHGDSSLHRLNFLRFSEAEWRRLGQNRLFHLNRLRAPEMRRLTEEAGLWTICFEAQADAADLAFVRSLALPPRFAALAPEENAIHLCHLLAEKP